PVIPTFSTANSSYHAANFKVEKRYSSGLNFLANYTVQKNLERNGTGPSAFAQNGGTSIVLDSHNLERERAVAPIDVPQILVVSYGYELPWGPGKRWLGGRGGLAKAFGGWQLNGITTLRGGFPTDIRTNVSPPIFNTFNVPDRVKGEPSSSARTAAWIASSTRRPSACPARFPAEAARRCSSSAIPPAGWRAAPAR
ncbi:MAG: hypothetical protein ACRDH2_13340, partial [Anaerolineales bacterium]